MIAALVIPTVFCAIACGVLVVAEARRWRRIRVVSKLVASAMFIAVGAAAMGSCGTAAGATGDPWRMFQTIVVMGLLLGAAGDAALLGKSDRAFLVGLGAFLLGHVAYVIAAGQLVPPDRWLSSAGPIAAAPAAVGLGVLAWLWPRLGSMRLPVIAYVLVIVAMVIGGIAILSTETLPEQNRRLFAAGAVLFFASDLAVARDKFVAATFVNRAWGLPCYYAGQLLIAWSLAPTTCG